MYLVKIQNEHINKWTRITKQTLKSKVENNPITRKQYRAHQSIQDNFQNNMSVHISGMKVRKQLRNILNQKLKTNLDLQIYSGNTNSFVFQIAQQSLLQTSAAISAVPVPKWKVLSESFSEWRISKCLAPFLLLLFYLPRQHGETGNWRQVHCGRVLLRFRKRPARDTVQQLDKPKETQLSIRVSNPVMKNSMNWDGWANA